MFSTKQLKNYFSVCHFNLSSEKLNCHRQGFSKSLIKNVKAILTTCKHKQHEKENCIFISTESFGVSTGAT